MKIIEVPVFGDDGSITAKMQYSPEEAQRLLQFATNFFMMIGNTSVIMKENAEEEMEFND